MNLIGTGVLLILSGGAGSIVLGRQARLADAVLRVTVVAGCGLGAFAAVAALAGRPPEPWTLMPTLPGGIWVAGLDGLSAWFLLLLSVVSGIATVFGVTYMRRERTRRSVAAVHSAWTLLVAAMMGVLVAQSAVLFLLTWEVMAVSAYFLIMFDHDREEVRRAGLVYLVLTHLGTLSLLLMFLSWSSGAPDFSFASLRSMGGSLPWSASGVLLLSLFGFGIKAGVFPFHFWLPGAHAAAPSHVSALLSGVMLKVGIYGLLRTLSLLGPPPAWWGWTVLALGLASSILGVLWALAQHDIKRALAYSSVENIGIILLGLGLGALGTAYHQPAVALLGYVGALLHTLNHALFKSLLFLGAGAVVHATGTREIDRLGGLARRMPRTATLFLIGSVAIVGLPPLNGFVSEWVLMLGFLGTGRLEGPFRFASVGAAGLGIVGALALACFVRLGGIVFLGKGRTEATRDAHEVGLGMILPMGLLGASCVIVGLVPAIALRPALRVAGVVSGLPEWMGDLPLYQGSAPILVPFGSSIVLVVLGVWLFRALVRRGRWAETWGCGFPEATPRMQYTASSFSLPLLRALPAAAGSDRAPTSGRFRTNPQDRVLRDVIQPLWDKVQGLAVAVRPLHQGRVTTYLQYMIWTVLLLLGFLLIASTVVPS